MTRFAKTICRMLTLVIAIGCSDGSGPIEDSNPNDTSDPNQGWHVTWVQLDAGAAATCGVADDGRGYCWGDGSVTGQGDAHGTVIASPREVPGNHQWAKIEVGRDIACGLTSAGETWCWGTRAYPLTERDGTPTLLDGDLGFSQITVGFNHACGLTDSGVGYCWGDDLRGQTGAGSDAGLVGTRNPTPIAGDLQFLALQAGPEATCGIVSGGALYCWGGSSVRGDGIDPRPVQPGYVFTDLAFGGNTGGRAQICADSASAALYCVGYQVHELLEQPTPVKIELPENHVPSLTSIGGIWTPFLDLPYDFQLHVCVVDVNGKPWCWGSNGYAQLGDGTTADRTEPTTMPQFDNLVQVTSGGLHTCALTADGIAYCWGSNHRGQLGVGPAVGITHLAPGEVAWAQP